MHVTDFTSPTFWFKTRHAFGRTAWDAVPGTRRLTGTSWASRSGTLCRLRCYSHPPCSHSTPCARSRSLRRRARAAPPALGSLSLRCCAFGHTQRASSTSGVFVTPPSAVGHTQCSRSTPSVRSAPPVLLLRTPCPFGTPGALQHTLVACCTPWLLWQ